MAHPPQPDPVQRASTCRGLGAGVDCVWVCEGVGGCPCDFGVSVGVGVDVNG